MVVEANKDEALLCLQKAKEAMLAKDVSKMKKFIAKAKKLDPNCDVSLFLKGEPQTNHESETERPDRSGPERSYSHDDHYEDTNLRQRRRPSHGSPSRNATGDTSSRNRSRSRSGGRAPEYSEEDRQCVDRIRHCKDYYEILQVSKDCTDITLKKRYRELALKLHPDKCKVPGATEAFKALGNAYAVLSDTKKRAEYDQYGAEGAQGSTRRRYDGFDYDVGRGFEAEVSPEDIFEMFFGGRFPEGHVYRRPGEPSYSLTREGEYTYMRTTRDLRVTYYVKKNFEQDYRGKISQIEAHVNNEYINQLRMKCYKEKNNRETMLWSAKMRGDNALWQKAQTMPLPSCRQLEELMA
ncbi:hypothetical protein FO519_003582 [Halicephalobus sp. NKZ332]|nr:hypothetical protein FO519_003582 [Halicephalobus sp. NKZ332]